jgi:glycosyltransferase involved in cell wall biosynthesis
MMDLTDWQLVIAGGLLNADQNSNRLEELAKKGQNITLEVNPPWDKLKQLYGQATLYWHAAGFGLEETLEPEKFEHFGMSTVEAMSAGAVPLAYDGGGQNEIINPGENGYLWKSKAELVSFTREVLHNETKRLQLAEAAKRRSQEFSEERFEDEWQKLIV